jgi:hypothetical protein
MDDNGYDADDPKNPLRIERLIDQIDGRDKV